MASRLFDDAKNAMAAGRPQEACPKYAESQRLDPQLGTLVHLGECYAKAGKTASAWASFKDAAEVAAQRNDPREPKIRERLTALEKTLSTVVITTVESEPADLEIRQDGDIVGKAAWGTPVPVDPGGHQITASARGRKPWSATVTVAANGATEHINVPMLEADASAQTQGAASPSPSAGQPQAPSASPMAPGVQTPTAPGHDSSSFRSNQRLLGWVATGAGVIGLGVGLIFELERSSKLSDRDAICPGGTCTATADQRTHIDSLTSDARSDSTIGIIGFVAGGVLAAGGLVLVFTAPSGEASSSTVAVLPVAAPGFQGVAVRGRVW